MMHETPSSDAERALRTLLVEAGNLALTLPAEPSPKQDGTLVTAADRAVEEMLVAGLRAAFPDDGIEGEEGTAVAGSSGARWYVDPIDGTGSFVEGLPVWGPTVARVENERVRLAGFYVPRTRQYFAVSDRAASLDGELLPSPTVARSPERTLFVPSRLHQFFDLRWDGKARSLGSTAAHLCLAAAGSARAAIVGPGWKPWDVLCGLAMIAATGGSTHAFRKDGSSGPLDPWRDRGLPFVAGDADSVRWLATPGTISLKEPHRP
jgi:myo-inositol-1(or 4)-monophosphatase